MIFAKISKHLYHLYVETGRLKLLITMVLPLYVVDTAKLFQQKAVKNLGSRSFRCLRALQNTKSYYLILFLLTLFSFTTVLIFHLILQVDSNRQGDLHYHIEL